MSFFTSSLVCFIKHCIWVSYVANIQLQRCCCILLVQRENNYFRMSLRRTLRYYCYYSCFIHVKYIINETKSKNWLEKDHNLLIVDVTYWTFKALLSRTLSYKVSLEGAAAGQYLKSIGCKVWVWSDEVVLLKLSTQLGA